MSLTVLQMENQVAAKLGQSDTTSRSLIRTFIGNRAKMVFDSFAWRDSEMTATASLASTNITTLPTGMDRIIAIRANGDTFLDPININMLLQTDPTIFERVGLPTVYEEYTDPADNSKKVKVYPTPNTTVALFIVGKRTMPALTADADVPILRNIDNVLISYAMGDMLERQRQYEKAKAKFEEAGAMLEAAKALETGQANQPRRSKQMTVAGNSLAELTDAVCARTGQWSLDSIILIKDFLRRNYQMIWDACNWSESTVIANVSSDGSEVILPVFFDRVISIRGDVNLGQLSVVEPSLLFGIAPSIFEQTGSPLGFSYLTPVGVGILPPTREKLAIKSASASDKTNVFVMGESAGGHVSENVVLNGTTEVLTANDYDTPLTVAKSVTVGDVRIRANTSNIVLETILAAERERKHMRLWIQPTPTATQTCLVLGKRTIKPLVQDEDTPMLRDVQSVLIAAASADMFSKMGNDKAAADARDQAKTSLEGLIKLETQQGAYSACVVPEVEYSRSLNDWSSDAWIVQKV